MTWHRGLFRAAERGCLGLVLPLEQAGEKLPASSRDRYWSSGDGWSLATSSSWAFSSSVMKTRSRRRATVRRRSLATVWRILHSQGNADAGSRSWWKANQARAYVSCT